METITTIDQKSMPNALFVQFMADVDAQVQHVTPEALKVKKCYAAFIIGKTKSTFFLFQKYKNNLAFKHLSGDV